MSTTADPAVLSTLQSLQNFACHSLPARVCLFRLLCLQQTELPRWVGETAKAPRLVEVEPTVCEGLVHFCLAEAQQMAIGKVRVLYDAVLSIPTISQQQTPWHSRLFVVWPCRHFCFLSGIEGRWPRERKRHAPPKCYSAGLTNAQL